jgi:energy-coupling factor transport system ATP-binding protein
MATVMINNPDFYIFDEPTTGLDELRRGELSEILDDLAASGKGMLIISHDRQFVQRHAKRLIRMEGGSLLEDRRIP